MTNIDQVVLVTIVVTFNAAQLLLDANWKSRSVKDITSRLISLPDKLERGSVKRMGRIEMVAVRDIEIEAFVNMCRLYVSSTNTYHERTDMLSGTRSDQSPVSICHFILYLSGYVWSTHSSGGTGFVIM